MRILIATVAALAAITVCAAPSADAGPLTEVAGLDIAPDVYIGFGYDHYPRRRYVRRTYYPRRVVHTYPSYHHSYSYSYPSYSYSYPSYSYSYPSYSYRYRSYAPRYYSPSVSFSYRSGRSYRGYRHSYRGHRHRSRVVGRRR